MRPSIRIANRQRRSLKRELPLFKASLSVTRPLQFETEQDAVDYRLNYTRGGRGMFLFTSNVTDVEGPPVNLVAAYQRLSSYEPKKGKPKNRHAWPRGRGASGNGIIPSASMMEIP
jgi:hypothetical protein